MTTPNIIFAATTITTALIAGLYYAYSCSVNPGLGNLPDAEYIRAMQSINIAIQNPIFFISFMGPLLLLPWCTYLYYSSKPTFYLLLAATLFYVFGSFSVTMSGNVPLNEKLKTFDTLTESADTIKQTATTFKNNWNALHSIRTIATIVSLILVILASFTKNNPTTFFNPK